MRAAQPELEKLYIVPTAGSCCQVREAAPRAVSRLSLLFENGCYRIPPLSPLPQPGHGPLQGLPRHPDIPLSRRHVLVAHECLKLCRWDAGRRRFRSEGVPQLVGREARHASLDREPLDQAPQKTFPVQTQTLSASERGQPISFSPQRTTASALTRASR